MAAQLVARSNGTSYSILLREEQKWRTTIDKSIEKYSPPKGYVPCHKRNLKRACKLLLSNHWRAYNSLEKELSSSRKK